MFPFWDRVVYPLIRATGARRVVEIGALRGENTVQLIEGLGPDAEVHVIDPVPDFDPEEHAQRFPGRYVFHRDLSLNVLPHLPAMDVALVDGDHNWYTVYHELHELARAARDADALLPVLICHDVTWPYGRRDLYYAPEQIPEEHRQPYAQRGMRLGRSPLASGHGGLNPTMCNALEEGGPRNGVMTAIDDFVAEYDGDLHVLVLPVYFGLAIVVDRRRIDATPALAAELDRIEGVEGQRDLVAIGEETRLSAMVFQHDVLYHRDRLLEAATRRYLDLVKDVLLDEHYLENELRIGYLAFCLESGATPDLELVRDPNRWPDKARRLRVARRSGLRDDDPHRTPGYFPYTEMGRVRLDHLESCLDLVRTEKVPGDLVEAGTGRGGGAVLLRAYLDAHDLKHRGVWVVDPFRAYPAAEPSPPIADLGADLNTVRTALDRFGLLDERVRFLQGPAADALADAPVGQVALLRIGTTCDDPVAVLDALYPKLEIGGVVIVEGLDDDDRARAVEGVRDRWGVEEPLEEVDWATAWWRKERATENRADAPGSAETGARRRAPIVRPTPAPKLDLSVVVVFYDMAREAERTLQSLSRAYQQGIDDLTYEVIAIDNGSNPGKALDKHRVRAFGPEFRYLSIGPDASPSPVPALNQGIAKARGEHLALMIDGAHVLTPGVLRYGMLGLRTYEPAVVATQHWYVGPGQQGEAMDEGYDQPFEDRLFDEIAWPTDGYRLFDISHFIGERDWLDGMGESNCLFVSRDQLRQVGAFDESFDLPGGEYANLEIFDRLTMDPAVTLVTILGEASFHQVHGGTTTNEASLAEHRDRLLRFAERYREIRGKPFRGPNKEIHYIGSMVNQAKRTRARRRISPNYFLSGAADDPDAPPSRPVPIPEDLQNAYTEAFWASDRWRDATWLGHPVARAPTDLFVYQQLITELRPDWIIETTPAGGGRALFLASICELAGHGRVVSVGARKDEELPEHPRVTFLRGRAFGPQVADRVRAVVGDDARCLAVLGSRGRIGRMVAEFETFAPFVPPGSYTVVEETIVNGHPVWASFGPGPHEAITLIMGGHPDWVVDHYAERFGLTFNPGGFLKRLR